jgi:hypothetical protein
MHQLFLLLMRHGRIRSNTPYPPSRGSDQARKALANRRPARGQQRYGDARTRPDGIGKDSALTCKYLMASRLPDRKRSAPPAPASARGGRQQKARERCRNAYAQTRACELSMKPCMHTFPRPSCAAEPASPCLCRRFGRQRAARGLQARNGAERRSLLCRC